MKTYDLARIADVVHAVAPEAVIYSNDITIGVQTNRWSGMWVYVDGRLAVDSAVLSRQDRAIVRAIMDELDAQDREREQPSHCPKCGGVLVQTEWTIGSCFRCGHDLDIPVPTDPTQAPAQTP